jgi:hypothetical protein
MNVYWCFLDGNNSFHTIEPLKKHFYKNYNTKTGLAQCPAFKDYINNIFILRSEYDYDFFIENNKVIVNEKLINITENSLIMRNWEDKLFSFSQHFIFFTEQESLNIDLLPPFLEDNNISKKCSVIPGTFNIGKWFRNIDFAFYLRKEYNNFSIKVGEVFYYIKFNTDEKINFIEFKNSELIKSLIKESNTLSKNRYVKKSLKNKIIKPVDMNFFYNDFKNKNIKKKILEEIYKNLT